MKIYGKNAVVELAKSDKIKINKVFLQSEFKNSKSEITNLLAEKNIKIEYAPKCSLDQKANGAKHQGIIAEIGEFEYADLDEVIRSEKKKGKPLFFVVLDGLEDPQNLGTILRVCECAGVSGVIIPKNRSVLVNETVAKVSAGALFYVNVIKVGNIHQTIKDLQSQNVFVYAADMDGNKMYNTNLTGDIALVIGGEGKGVSELSRKIVDGIISIPMFGKINSLNASVSCGICVFEVVRQRENNGRK